MQYVGQACLLNCNVLVIKGQSIHFFKREKVENEFMDVHKSDFVWERYHTLNENALFCNNPGSNDILVVTQVKIYLYSIDPLTLTPILRSVIFNFMGCTYLVQSQSKETQITYQVGSEDFIVYKRNYHHNFRVAVDYKHHRECIAIDVKKCQVHCISDGLKITFYSDKKLKQLKDIPQVQVENQNQERILNMKICKYHEETLVVFIGKILPKGVKKVTAIKVYQLNYDNGEENLLSVELIYSRKLREELQKIS